MNFVIGAAIFAAIVVAYVVWIRPYLRAQPQFADLWKREESAWAAFKIWVQGRRTVLAGVWGEFLIWLPDMLQSLNLGDLATALHWDDAKKALANVFLTMLMIVFRTKAKS